MVIDGIVADRRYSGISELAIPSTVQMAAFEFHGRSLKTRQGAIVYRYRLKGYVEDWRSTRAGRVEYQDLSRGNYTFEVEAVDRDLVYSEAPAAVRLTIHPPYRAIALAGGLGVSLLALAMVSGYAIKKRRDLFREMAEELHTAHDLQMGLMPTSHPTVRGIDIAGRCLPANTVGGDFFQYFDDESMLTAAMADVTGHAMDAAIPVVMFSGVLDRQMELAQDIGETFSSLNRNMHSNLDKRTFVCFTMGELDPATRLLRLANAACPYPYHYQASSCQVAELAIGGYPLGVRPDTEYEVMDVQLEPGDRVVFCSDGIIEADNAADEQFGYERTAEAIRQACEENLSAEATIDRLLEEVAAFKGDAPQSDDMACVVVRVLCDTTLES